MAWNTFSGDTNQMVLAGLYAAVNGVSVIPNYISTRNYAMTLDHTDRTQVYVLFDLTAASLVMNIAVSLFWIYCLRRRYIAGLKWVFIYFLVHLNTTILASLIRTIKDLIVGRPTPSYVVGKVDLPSDPVPVLVWILIEAFLVSTLYMYYMGLYNAQQELQKKVLDPVFSETIIN